MKYWKMNFNYNQRKKVLLKKGYWVFKQFKNLMKINKTIMILMDNIRLKKIYFQEIQIKNHSPPVEIRKLIVFKMTNLVK